MQNKTKSLLLAALLFQACRGGAPSGDLPRIGLLLPGSGEGLELSSAIQTLGHGKAIFQTRDAQGLRPGQAEQLDASLKGGSQAVLVSCVDPADAGAFIEKAKAAKVPLVFFGARPAAADLVKWDKAYYLGTSPTEKGKAQAELGASLWGVRPGSDRNRDGIMQFAVLRDQPNPESTEMAQGIFASMASPGKPSQRLADAVADSGQEGARKLLAAWTARYGQSLELVLCAGDEASLSALPSQGSKGLPMVLASGNSGAVLSAIASGLVQGTVAEDTGRVAKAALDLASALARSSSPQGLDWTISDNKYLWVPPLKVSKDNLEEALGKTGGGERR